jgi:hypothetical protein
MKERKNFRRRGTAGGRTDGQAVEETGGRRQQEVTRSVIRQRRMTQRKETREKRKAERVK